MARVPIFNNLNLVTIATLIVTSVLTLTGATITGNMVPTANNTYDIGTNALKWKNAYLEGDLSASGTARVQNMTVYGTCTGCGTTTALQAAYNAATSTTELSISGGNALTVADTLSGVGNIFEIQDLTNPATGAYSTRYLTVSSTATTIANLTLTNALSIASGGLGSSLADPGLDTLIFWDESANRNSWLYLGGGLSITNNIITVAEASTSATGTVEVAIASELNTGTDTLRAVSPDALAGSNFGIRSLEVVAFDYTTDTATGDGKAYVTVPNAFAGMNLVNAHARVITAGTTNSTTVQIHNLTQAADMLSALLEVETGETGSDTAAPGITIDTANDDVAAFDLIRLDVDSISTTAAKGLIITLDFQLP